MIESIGIHEIVLVTKIAPPQLLLASDMAYYSLQLFCFGGLDSRSIASMQ
jgi:hypothetical protein